MKSKYYPEWIRRVVEMEKGAVYEMHSTPILCIGAGVRACAGRATTSEANLRTFELCSALFRFGTIQTYTETFFTNGNAVISKGEIVLVKKLYQKPWESCLEAEEIPAGPFRNQRQ